MANKYDLAADLGRQLLKKFPDLTADQLYRYLKSETDNPKSDFYSAARKAGYAPFSTDTGTAFTSDTANAFINGYLDSKFKTRSQTTQIGASGANGDHSTASTYQPSDASNDLASNPLVQQLDVKIDDLIHNNNYNQASVDAAYSSIPGLKDLDKKGDVYYSAMSQVNNLGNGLTNPGLQPLGHQIDNEIQKSVIEGDPSKVIDLYLKNSDALDTLQDYRDQKSGGYNLGDPLKKADDNERQLNKTKTYDGELTSEAWDVFREDQDKPLQSQWFAQYYPNLENDLAHYGQIGYLDPSMGTVDPCLQQPGLSKTAMEDIELENMAKWDKIFTQLGHGDDITKLKTHTQNMIDGKTDDQAALDAAIGDTSGADNNTDNTRRFYEDYNVSLTGMAREIITKETNAAYGNDMGTPITASKTDVLQNREGLVYFIQHYSIGELNPDNGAYDDRLKDPTHCWSQNGTPFASREQVEEENLERWTKILDLSDKQVQELKAPILCNMKGIQYDQNRPFFAGIDDVDKFTMTPSMQKDWDTIWPLIKKKTDLWLDSDDQVKLAEAEQDLLKGAYLQQADYQAKYGHGMPDPTDIESWLAICPKLNNAGAAVLHTLVNDLTVGGASFSDKHNLSDVAIAAKQRALDANWRASGWTDVGFNVASMLTPLVNEAGERLIAKADAIDDAKALSEMPKTLYTWSDSDGFSVSGNAGGGEFAYNKSTGKLYYTTPQGVARDVGTFKSLDDVESFISENGPKFGEPSVLPGSKITLNPDDIKALNQKMQSYQTQEHVIRDPATQGYYVTDADGNRLPGSYAKRSDAAMAAGDYKADIVRDGLADLKAQTAVPKLNSGIVQPTGATSFKPVNTEILRGAGNVLLRLHDTIKGAYSLPFSYPENGGQSPVGGMGGTQGQRNVLYDLFAPQGEADAQDVLGIDADALQDAGQTLADGRAPDTSELARKYGIPRSEAAATIGRAKTMLSQAGYPPELLEFLKLPDEDRLKLYSALPTDQKQALDGLLQACPYPFLPTKANVQRFDLALESGIDKQRLTQLWLGMERLTPQSGSTQVTPEQKEQYVREQLSGSDYQNGVCSALFNNFDK